MSEYQPGNLHVVTHEVTGAARSVWWGAQHMKRSLNAVWGWTRLSDPRGPVPYVVYHICSPPTLHLSLRDIVHFKMELLSARRLLQEDAAPIRRLYSQAPFSDL